MHLFLISEKSDITDKIRQYVLGGCVMEIRRKLAYNKLWKQKKDVIEEIKMIIKGLKGNRRFQ